LRSNNAVGLQAFGYRRFNQAVVELIFDQQNLTYRQAVRFELREAG